MSQTYNKNLPDWQDGSEDDGQNIQAQQQEPANYMFVDVRLDENLGDLAKRVYGSNNVINRLKLDLANNGNITGRIRAPK